jgi:UDP-3-O-[3-hydroxymyristoyl] glucosamine N-acyltransferase
MQITAADLSILVDGVLEGDPNIIISGPSRIENGAEGTISFLANMKYEPFIYTSKASAFLVSHNFHPNQTLDATLIRVDDVYKTITFYWKSLMRKYIRNQLFPNPR